MPSHQERREPLPKGYRFGDAHGHDYRAKYVAAPFVYHAICCICGDDAGVVAFPTTFESFEWPSIELRELLNRNLGVRIESA